MYQASLIRTPIQVPRSDSPNIQNISPAAENQLSSHIDARSSSQSGAQKRGVTIQPAEHPAPKRNAKRWPASAISMMMQLLIHLAINGKQTGAQGFRMSEYCDVARQLQAAGYDFDSKQLRNKYDDLKKTWKEWLKHLSRVSGWDRHDDDVPFNHPTVEEEYFLANPNSRQFRRKAPRFLNECKQLFSTDFTTGESSRSIKDSTNEIKNGREPAEVGSIDLEPERAEHVDHWESSSTIASRESLVTIGIGREMPTLFRRPTSFQTQPATDIAKTSRGPNLQVSRLHHREDWSTASLDHWLVKASQAILELAKSKATPLESALTRATTRLGSMEFVKSLEFRHRIMLFRSLSKDGNAEIVLGLGDEDLELFAAHLLESLRPIQRPMNPNTQRFGGMLNRYNGPGDGYNALGLGP